MASSHLPALVALLLCAILTTTSGSAILFSNSHNAVQALLTRTMTMRCSLNDTRQLVNGAVIGKRDVTEVDENLQHLTSIIVMRNGTEVASVTQFGAVQAFQDTKNLKVTGHVSGTSGERGFLELTWKYPTTEQAGEYLCEVNGVTDRGHNVVFSKALEIGVSEPSIGDLVSTIRDMYLQIDNNTACMNGPRHTEHGQVNCGDSNNWTGVSGNQKYITISTQFKTPFSYIPVVQLSVNNWSNDGSATGDINLQLDEVTRYNFTMKCKLWHGLHVWNYRVNYIGV